MKNLVITILPVLLLTGCVTLYKPNLVQSPLLKNKGDFNSTAAVGLSGAGTYNLQAAYAISDHTGLMANGMYHYRKTEGGDGSVDKLNVYSLEVGAGYFNRFANDKGLLQFYGGAGVGNTSDKLHNVQQVPPEVKASYNNIFIQPGIAFINKNMEMAFDLRCNYVNINNIHAYLYDQFEWWNTDFHYYSDTSFYFVNLEPTFTMKIGGKKVKGFIQSGITIPTIHSDSYFLANSSSMAILPLFKFSVGITYSLGRKQPIKN